MRVAVLRLEHCYRLPETAYPGDAGFDLYAANFDPIPVAPGSFARIPTGIALGLPPATMALVQPRSGLAARHGITVLNSPGLVDSGYRGEVMVLLVNHGDQAFFVERGQRIAQLVILPVPAVQWEEVQALETSERQTGGFGSSGL